MPTFWENIFRFPRFFISSVIGLLLIILGPALNLLRKPQTAILFLVALSILIIFISSTLKAMLNLE